MTFDNNGATVATAVGTEVGFGSQRHHHRYPRPEPLPKAPMAARLVPSP